MIANQLVSYPSGIDSLQDLMDITMELDTREHERQKEKTHHQAKKPEDSKLNSSHTQSSSSANRKKKNFQKRYKPHSSFLNEVLKLMNYERERIINKGLCTYCGGKNTLESCFKGSQNQLSQPSGKFPSQGKG
ncbi:hypothetical protein O181_029779 [Austropuccinia psidii MF-1]|uniref:Uncharacterized protein n=1 Tax=Austropuccinia psidii MF-1 TaxID=1389203 RepID=A0A9Q3CRJ2_9BASI|nr:hypothetical protein [Austropuccinia psidii MF-1]